MARYQKKQEKRKKKRTILVLLYFSLAVLILGAGWQTQKIIGQSRWDGEGRINLVVGRDAPFLVSFEPAEKTITGVLMPPEAFLEVPHGFGFYRLGAVYQLGQLEGRGGRLLSETIQEFLGVPVDGYLSFSPPTNTDEANQMLKEFVGWRGLLNFLGKGNLADFKTDLITYDLVRFFWQANGVPALRVKFIDLLADSSFSDLILPEGTVVKKPDFERIQTQLEGKFEEERAKKESLKIEVLNSTDVPGLGNQAARIITNLGGEVLKVGNLAQLQEGCEIRSAKENLKSFTLKRIAQIFSCKILGEVSPESRADAVVILGK